MKTLNLYIQNLCCTRCKTSLIVLLSNFGAKVIDVQNGMVVILINENILLSDIENLLKLNGFKLLSERETILINQIKSYLSEFVENQENENIRISDYIVSKINMSYSYLSSYFQKSENITIEKFYISLKIEKVKELILTNQYTLSEIAYDLSYSSVQALSQQFKKFVGTTVKDYKKIKSTYSLAVYN